MANRESAHLKSIQPLALLAFLMFSGELLAEMKALEDSYLAGVSGQSGLTLDLEANVSVAELAYFDDGKGIALQGLRLSSAANPTDSADFRFEMDILNDGALACKFSSKNVARFEITEIRFIDNPGITPVLGSPSMGGIFFDFMIDGYHEVRGGGVGGPGTTGYTFDINFSIADGRLGYRTNGNEFFLDGLTLDINSLGTTLDTFGEEGINLRMPNLTGELGVQAIRYSKNPLNHGVTNDVTTGLELASYGSLWVNFDLDTALQIKAGGAFGAQGLTLNSQTAINRLDLAWGDDTDWANTGYWVGALGTTGSVNISNLTVDIEQDPDTVTEPAKDYGLGLALAFERLEAYLHVRDFVLGETKSNIDGYVLDSQVPVKSIGSLDINLLFADGAFGLTPNTNIIYLQAGGNVNAGYQGLRLDTQLSIISPNNESNFIYTDDGNSLMASRFEAFADGDLTVNVTAAGNLGGTDFYDGLRIGFEDFAFGYRVEGYRAATSTGNVDDLKASEMQAAQTIPGVTGMLGVAGYPSLEGTLNGHITLGPGGALGAEGITINSDLYLTDGSLATFIQGDGTTNGVWLSGLNYDVHLRDMKLDVTNDGLHIYESESWSKMDVTDFRIGDKESGASFGRLILESYEVGSESTVSAGGAGAFCMEGVGTSSSQCTASGGHWENRGGQGLTIDTKRFFMAKNEVEGKRNRITWETNRTGEGTATPINGSGMQLVFDNFTTGDGNGLTDTYGFRATHHIDVARTRVLKKSSGADSNGVVGNKGDEKIMDAGGGYHYVAAGSVTAADRTNRPVGMAVRTETSFKELDFERVNLVHPTGGESTLLYGLKMQNFNITTDITATPLD